MKMHVNGLRLYVTSPRTSYSERGWICFNDGGFVLVTASRHRAYENGKRIRVVRPSPDAGILAPLLCHGAEGCAPLWPHLLLALLNDPSYRAPTTLWLADVETPRTWEKGPS